MNNTLALRNHNYHSLLVSTHPVNGVEVSLHQQSDLLGYDWQNLRDKSQLYLHTSLTTVLDEKALVENAFLIKDFLDQWDISVWSDHLAWTGVSNSFRSDCFIPIPFTKKSLAFQKKRIDLIQNITKRKMCLENSARLFEYREDEMTEIEFMNELVCQTGCGLLFDISNFIINGTNYSFSIEKEFSKLNYSAIEIIHFAGYDYDHTGFLIDTHSSNVTQITNRFLRRLKERTSAKYCVQELDQL